MQLVRSTAQPKSTTKRGALNEAFEPKAAPNELVDRELKLRGEIGEQWSLLAPDPSNPPSPSSVDENVDEAPDGAAAVVVTGLDRHVDLGEIDEQELCSFFHLDFAAEFYPPSPSTNGEQDSPDGNVDEPPPGSAAAVLVMGSDIGLGATAAVDAAAEMAAPGGLAMAVDEGHAVAAQLGRALADNHATGDAPRAVSLQEQASRQSFLGVPVDAAENEMAAPSLGRFLRQRAADLESQSTTMSPGVSAVVENLRQTSNTLNDGLTPADTNAVRVLFGGIRTLLGLNSQQTADVALTAFRHAKQNLTPQEPVGSAAASLVVAHELQMPVAAAQFAPVVVGQPLPPKLKAGFVCAPQPNWSGYFNVHNIEYSTRCEEKVQQPDGSFKKKRQKITKKIFGGDHLTQFDTSLLQPGVAQVPARSVITDTRIRLVQDRVDNSIWLWIPLDSSPESVMREATGVQEINNHFGEMLRHGRTKSCNGWVGSICHRYPGGSERLSVMSEF